MSVTPLSSSGRITLDHPWLWLAAGWEDFCAAPILSCIYGAIFAAIGTLLTVTLHQYELDALILPAAFGFALVGPLAAAGLYEISRRRERSEVLHWFGLIPAIQRNPGQIALVGAFLLLALIAWTQVALLEFMLFFGTSSPAPDGLWATLFLSPQSMPFLMVGALSGGLIAAGVFAMTVVALPMLVDRPDCGAMTAMFTSLEVCRKNWRPMVLWAGMIASLTILGLTMFFVGLAIALPLVGYGSWHAYRDLVTSS